MHFQTRPTFFVLGGLLLVTLVLGATVMALTAQPTPSAAPTASPTPGASPTPVPSPTPTAAPTATSVPTPSPTPSPVAVCPMNGLPPSDPALAERVPIIAQIENNPIARPPSGLNLADLVIEAPVEGDTTRFMAVYMCRESIGAAVGPIRSARYFNIDLFQQLRGVTFHFGGGGRVLARLDRNDVARVNGLEGGGAYFVRAGPWGAPHNVYLDVDAARAAMEGGSLSELVAIGDVGRPPFVFDPDAALPPGRAVSSIRLTTASFWHFGWQWDAASGLWLRTDAGAPNTDRLSGERINARTVIVQVVRQDVLPGELDPGGYPRRFQHLIGEGTGVLYVDGQGHDVLWSRPSKGYMTRWTYADSGEPVVLPPGRVWWEIVPEGSAISDG
ncbi:MAG TPA: DUF3048 domain-containing protein [Candidatus Binatia bacterium]|nr:DUF3048 domain-containing protein [Candidatus Binatia bacterium]